MKKAILFFFIVFVSFISNAQLPFILNEEYTDNKRGWWVGDWAQGTTSLKGSVSGGYYYLATEGTGRMIYQGVPLEPEKDFVIETIITVTENREGYGAGIFCGSHDNFNNFSFQVSTNKFYSIGGVKQGKYNEYVAWTTFDAINGKGLPNKLKIECKGKVMHFYINNKLVKSLENIRLGGNKIGFELGRAMKVKIDKLSVAQVSSPMKYVEGFTADMKKEHLNENINSPQSELGPVMSPDGKYLYIARRERPEDIEDSHPCDDIWISEKQLDGSWGPLKKLPYPVNDLHNNDMIAVSPDNNTLLMSDTACGPTDQIRFFISNRTANGWSKPVSSSMINGYNLDKYFEATVSSDGRVILITMQRNDSYGERDIYVTFKLNETQWSEPKNIGHVVNSFGNELGPFLAPDNVTLYYASDGKKGFGESDIYVTRRLDDSWTKWSEPENLGNVINTPAWDAYYTVSAQGDYAYFVSNDVNSFGRSDVYRVRLPQAAKPEPVVIVFGKVLNAKTNQPIEALISFETLPEGKNIGEQHSSPKTGEYKMVLPYGKKYGYHAKSEGYIAVNENFDLVEKKDYIEIEQNLFLVPIEVGETIKLNNVFFEQGRDVMMSTSFPELDRLVEILTDNPHMEIELRGHTDSQGDPQLNFELSQKRVNKVKQYLVSKGISEKRIVGKGFGGSKPIASNAREETRQLNRRVEFVIMKK